MERFIYYQRKKSRMETKVFSIQLSQLSRQKMRSFCSFVPPELFKYLGGALESPQGVLNCMLVKFFSY